MSKELSRRTFVQGSALAGLGAAALGGSALFGCSSELAETGADGKAEPAPAEEKIVWNHCAINCPGRCALKLHVVDDEIVRVETYAADSDDMDDIQPRACLRGRAYRAWVNHPDRINYPMKRAEGSKRGEGKYEQITWDEAIEIIARNYQEVIDNYGPEAVYMNYCTGNYGVTARPWFRLLNSLGNGYLAFYGNYSLAQLMWITPYIFGASVGAGSSLSAARDSDLVLMFGTSPVETRQGGAVSHHDYVAMREMTKGKIYVIDPRFNDSLAGRSDEWLPINPGTDAALVAAIAHELIANNQVDKEFLDTYCVGFDEATLPASAQGQNKSYQDYIMGTGYDKVEKTPEWAAPITGIAADKIRALAGEIAAAKALFVDQGWGPQRRSNGEMTGWSICMLPILTGNIGLPGTSNGLREGSYSVNLTSMPDGENPVKAKISVFSMVDAIDRGHEMTEKADGVTGVEQLPCDIKFVINYAGNCITNQNSDINWVHDVMSDESKCQFVLGSDILMTDSLKYSDVILPDLFRLEQPSMIGTGGDGGYMLAGSEPYAPKFERKSAYDAAALIAAALGKEEAFTEGKTQEDWLRECYETSREKDPELPTYEEAMEMGVYTRKNPAGAVIAMAEFRADPVANPLDTPSGKIEIYSEALADYIAAHEFADDDFVAPIPVYAPEWYGAETVTDEFPLQLSGFHYRGRLHSSWGGVEILKELNPQEAWINPSDAAERGIEQGDTVRVENQFGAMELLAKVTPRVIPGTVACAQGAWHDADMNGDRVDKGGCINTLTTHRPSPFAKGNPQHTNICQVTKA
ncbi:DMSO/selenate family reductase complex A subunit [Adlercreutzia muris]|jgi:Tat-targeted selenate reductase subunit YnfE|uniref:DMSO/selenate family reductase complex A subunit n=1 Tax=Adlercreutzia muris TaxID=1796610 RepID=UPI0013654335|nr:DMSO/selenate family reductase complex A subunit [Adlercreutzia muris]MCI8306044.1 molybdopterin-dependent oxidoreductase [Enterorhabdus sp.]MCU7584643.1 molybdopterin-dependent oxidoreductase [Adlercreutzia muris]NCA31504.1 dimethyl sulfoxide reductase subunit A [Adlercreutzia muris]